MGSIRHAIVKKTGVLKFSGTSTTTNHNDSGADIHSLKLLKKWGIFLIIFLLIVLTKIFLLQRIEVVGVSMLPTFHNGDMLMVEKYNKRIQRFDIVIVNQSWEKIVKRVIGLPGETITIKDGKVFINGKVLNGDYGSYIKSCGIAKDNYKIGKDEYFVMGDNRNESMDSRKFGTVKITDIDGIAFLRIYPFTSINFINR